MQMCVISLVWSQLVSDLIYATLINKTEWDNLVVFYGGQKSAKVRWGQNGKILWTQSFKNVCWDWFHTWYDDGPHCIMLCSVHVMYVSIDKFLSFNYWSLWVARLFCITRYSCNFDQMMIIFRFGIHSQTAPNREIYSVSGNHKDCHYSRHGEWVTALYSDTLLLWLICIPTAGT